MVSNFSAIYDNCAEKINEAYHKNEQIKAQQTE